MYKTITKGGKYIIRIYVLMRKPVAGRFKAWVCGHSLDGIAGTNPAGGIDVCLLWVLWVVR
jgi:hypothetical protein